MVLTLRFLPEELEVMLSLLQTELRRVSTEEETERYKDMLDEIMQVFVDHGERPKTAQESPFC